MNLKNIVIIILIFIFSSNVNSQDKNIWITTKLKENLKDKNGNNLTGKGVVIGDIDSGIDIFNPMFFFADGGEFGWIDKDKNGKFNAGIDEVIVNGKNIPLNYIEMKDNSGGYLGADKKNFNPDMDFLYADINGNKIRDYGEKDGFTEESPAFGEQLFIAIDENKNNTLDVGEKLIALKTSKVKAVREKDGTVRRRGIDLIKANVEGVDHGTGVAGIILGGHYGVQKVHGFAPDAEIVMAKVFYYYTPRFVRNFPDLINFIKNEIVNIMLFEDGEWGWEFMDGSTEEELMTNKLAEEGITCIGAGGNLATGQMHIKDDLKEGTSRSYTINCPDNAGGKKNDGAFVSFLWKGEDKNIEIQILTPDKSESPVIKEGSDFIRAGKYNIFYSKDVSDRGTVMLRLGFSQKDSNHIGGLWKINVKANTDISFDGFLIDISQSWGYVSYWDSDKLTDFGTVTFPTTADSCISVGAYTVNVSWGDVIGDICYYSGRGNLISGRRGIDICAPGHVTFSTGTNNSYQQFSGTSAAAPHAVGTAALLLQINPGLTHSQIKQILINTAIIDKFTLETPNDIWGYGKLNPEGAVKYTLQNY